MTARRYSRLASTQEKKNIKKAYFYIFLSILTLIFLVLFGIPMLVKFAGFIGEIAKSDRPVEINDITPPAPPQFDEIPEFTKDEILVLSGQSETAATIKITSNYHDSEIIANNEGKFSFTFSLQAGENTIKAIAVDPSGNKSTETRTFTIIFDNQEPEVEISAPTDSSTFFGNSQRQILIKGVVNETVDLTINNKFVAVRDDYSFSYATTLSEGENKFEIVAKDYAGNESSNSLTVTFSL